MLELVTPEEFEKRLSEYRTQNKLVNQLINNLGGWEKFPDHLKQVLFNRMGCKPQINKY